MPPQSWFDDIPIVPSIEQSSTPHTMPVEPSTSAHEAPVPPVRRSTRSVARRKWLGDYLTGAVKTAPSRNHSQFQYAMANYVEHSKLSSNY